MNKHLTNNRKAYISISKAAKYLGVSPDTLRNWEVQGKISPSRTEGGSRRFKLAELEEIRKQTNISAKKPLRLISISKAAKYLGVSPDTLRNWEEKKLIRSQRTEGGARRFSKKDLSVFKRELEVDVEPPDLYQPTFEPNRHKSYPLEFLKFITRVTLPISILIIALLVLAFAHPSNLFKKKIAELNSARDEEIQKQLYALVSSVESLQKQLYALQSNTNAPLSSVDSKTISKAINSDQNNVLGIRTDKSETIFNVNNLIIAAGNGVTTTVSGTDTLTIDLDVTTTSSSNTTTTNSGLETTSSGLSLLRGCSDSEILSWDATNVYWECSSVTGIGGGDITAVGSMTSAAAFTDITADDDWLGLGSNAGRIEFDDQSTDEVNILSANVGIGDSTPDALLDLDSSSAAGGDFLITNTGAGTSGSIAQITADSVISGDIFTISSAGLTSGTALAVTGPSGGTVGMTDALVKLSANTGDLGSGATPSNGLLSVTASLFNPNHAEPTANVYLSSTVNSQATLSYNYAIYNTFSDSISQGNLNYGMYNKMSNGADYSKSMYGLYVDLVSNTMSTASGTDEGYGLYITSNFNSSSTAATKNQYGIYLANGTSTTSGTTNKYGIFLESHSGADNNYAICFDCDGTYSSSTAANGLTWGSDANAVTLYRSGNDTLKTDGAFLTGSTLDVGSIPATGSYTAALCWDNSGGSQVQDCVGSVSADYAEIYPVELNVEYGEIVTTGSQMVDILVVETDNKGNPLNETKTKLSKLTKSFQPYQSVIGITSSNWADFSSTAHNTVKEEDNPMPVALSGRVPVKISTENGPISKGDFLTTSSTPGVAMKARKPGQVIGKALEEFSCHSELVSESQQILNQAQDDNTCLGKIIVFVNVSYADPNDILANLTLDTDGSLIVPKVTSDTIQVTTNLEIGGELTVNGTTIDSSTLLAVGNVVNSLNQIDKTVSLLASEINSLEFRVESSELRVQNLEQEQATDSADLILVKDLSQKAIHQTASLDEKIASTSSNLANLSSQIDSLLSNPDSSQLGASNNNLTDPSVLLATDSAKLAKLDVEDSLSTLNLAALDSVISGTFKSLGESFLGNTTIAGDFSVDGTFSITGNSINSLGSYSSSDSEKFNSSQTASSNNNFGVLYIQNSPLASLVDFFNGLVTIDKDGSVKAEKIQANEVKVAEIKLVANKTSGSGNILANTKSVDISNILVSQNSRILITPTIEVDLSLAVTKKVDGQKFTVSTPKIVGENISFDWIIINEE